MRVKTGEIEGSVRMKMRVRVRARLSERFRERGREGESAYDRVYCTCPLTINR